MKKDIMLSLILFLCFISACSQKEIELYEKELLENSGNWEVKLYLAELSLEESISEENTWKFKYLKDVEEEMHFQYEFIFGDPPYLAIGPIEGKIINNEMFEETQYDQKMIEAVRYHQLTLNIYWEDDEEELQEESFIFKDF